MFSKHFYPILALGVYLFIGGCDPTTSPKELTDDVPSVQAALVIPGDVEFQATDGFKDTTLTFAINAAFNNLGNNIPHYVVRNKETEKILTEDILTYTDFGHVGNFQISTTTTSYEDYFVEIYVYDEEAQGNYYQTSISIRGLSNNRPVITDTTSPGTIIRPSSGETLAVFTATVTDADGDNTIDRVFLRIIDQTSGEVEGSPFLMSDNGSSLGDETADDQIYTWSYGVPGNPDSGIIDRDYDIEFFALDKGGLYSDTLRTTFHIRGS